MASGGRTGKRGGSPASGTGKAGARPSRSSAARPGGSKTGGSKTRAAGARAPAKTATTAGKGTRTDRARPAWTKSRPKGGRRAPGGRGAGTPPPISRRAILGGTALFAVGAALGLHLRRWETQGRETGLISSAASGDHAIDAPSPRPPGTVTMADMPDAASVTIDLPMAEGASPEVLAAPLRPARVMRPDQTVLAGHPAADSAAALPRVPAWLSSLGPAPPTPAPPGAPPRPGHKPAEGHVVRAPGSASTAVATVPSSHGARRPVPATPRGPLWLANALAIADPGARPMVTVVIDDLGLDHRRTARVAALPGPLTLSFMSYAGELPAQTAAGRRAGHELMLHMPMQPSSARVNPGPGALMVGQSADEIRRRLDGALRGFAGYVGLNNHMGSRFTANPAGMGVVMDEVRRRQLLFLDSRTTGGSVAPGLAARAGVPFIERSIFLDHDPGRATVDRQLAQLERVAARHGHAIAIGHPRDATIAGLSAWLGPAQARGLALVPASAIPRFARLT
ncbi:divergent polysaccharide deacetylase family protein [Roseospira visakhapatnamensis]|uniref:Divergent polysaccharide deacetylase family protein n=1 Tax=Roseospira visakhapatnamensis TaxID=390880 RepID=A0A7W6RG43_9PROT|nr:divergent polysaccharide deacetylase family protein [Roseospira visakhapatnamensis]MBB4267253.1 hypothetical protein [Roseospira visakhapatnamensis]